MPARPSASRRTVLRGAAVAPVAGIGLAACSAGDRASVGAAPTAPVELGAENEVTKGGVKLYQNHNVVVSRDAQGALKAYSTICTHAGCAINKLRDTMLICPCHGSEFDAMSGKVIQAPATEPLSELSVRTSGGKIIAGPAA